MSGNIYKYSLIALGSIILFFASAIISYQITLKSEMVTLPDLTGLTVEEAEAALQKKKLLLIKSGMALHERIEKEKIISQDPLPGSRIAINETVRVALSAGKEKIVVPDFIGRSLQSVSQQLIMIDL